MRRSEALALGALASALLAPALRASAAAHNLQGIAPATCVQIFMLITQA
jgi:hypothetical protein